MPAWAYILGAALTLAGPYLAFRLATRKWPVEKQKITVDTVDVNVMVAGRLRDYALDDRARMKKDLDDLRAEFHKHKAETKSQLRLYGARLSRLSAWAHKAFGVMTPEQRAEVGAPPIDDPLEEMPLVDDFSSMHPPGPGD